jgi:hypothetical protein
LSGSSNTPISAIRGTGFSDAPLVFQKVVQGASAGVADRALLGLEIFPFPPRYRLFNRLGAMSAATCSPNPFHLSIAPSMNAYRIHGGC